MTSSSRDVEKLARALAAEERAQLADALLASLQKTYLPKPGVCLGDIGKVCPGGTP